jgi:hypothetical protein
VQSGEDVPKTVPEVNTFVSVPCNPFDVLQAEPVETGTPAPGYPISLTGLETHPSHITVTLDPEVIVKAVILILT